MDIKCHFDHYNINVAYLDRSLEFYRKALNLRKTGEIVHPDGDFIINYLVLWKPRQAASALS